METRKVKQKGQALIETLIALGFSFFVLSVFMVLLITAWLSLATERIAHEALLCEQTLNETNCYHRFKQSLSMISFGLAHQSFRLREGRKLKVIYLWKNNSPLLQIETELDTSKLDL